MYRRSFDMYTTKAGLMSVPIQWHRYDSFTYRKISMESNLNDEIECITEGALTCQLSLREVASAGTVQPNVQGQEGDSTLTERIEIPRHVTPGNTGGATLPLFLLSILRLRSDSDSVSPTIDTDPERQPIAKYSFSLPHCSIPPTILSSFLQSSPWPSSERVADSPFVTSMISHSMHEKSPMLFAINSFSISFIFLLGCFFPFIFAVIKYIIDIPSYICSCNRDRSFIGLSLLFLTE